MGLRRKEMAAFPNGVKLFTPREGRVSCRKFNIPGRNDPCPCGSGKKYKKCHLQRPPVGKCPRCGEMIWAREVTVCPSCSTLIKFISTDNTIIENKENGDEQRVQ